MKWINYTPKVGDIRVRKRFLIFPKTINGCTKWLTCASWLEKYWGDYWSAMKWIEPGDYQ